MAKKAVKKKKTKGIFENRLSIVFITMVVVSMAIVLGVKVRSIKKELANREAYNQKIVKELESESERAKELDEKKKYVQTDSYIIAIKPEN